MNLVETYTYLRRARQTLWATLEAVPDDVLAVPMLPGDRFYCIKDLLLHIAAVHDAPDEHYTVDGLLWHVVLHEVRHTAQICLLLRLQGIVPPALDLLFFLPRA